MGALAVAPSDPSIVWAGTGEPHIRSNVSLGTGVYKSTDAGRTWRHMGLGEGGPTRTSRIVVHPHDPDIVYVGALGHAHGPQQARGAFRTMDGGESWEHVLFADENTGASSIEMDPSNPRRVFAGMWTVEVHTWGRESGGEGSGICLSEGGGDTWRKLEGNGLPLLPVGKTDMCLTPADPNRVYALIETGDGVPWHGRETESGEFWRSLDAGSTWELMNHSRDLGGRTAYYNNCFVSPDDPDEVYFQASGLSRSLDGGATYVNHQGLQRPGGDFHDNRQDGPSFRGPSNSRTGGFGGIGGPISRSEWVTVGGGEGGFATPDPEDPNIVWSSASGSGARGGSHDRNTVFVTSQHVHRTMNGGQSWEIISPDLTTNDESRMGISGGLTPDNIGVEFCCVIYARSATRATSTRTRCGPGSCISAPRTSSTCRSTTGTTGSR